MFHVAPEFQKSAIREQQTLNQQHTDHRQECGVRSKQCRQHHTAAEMAARTRAWNGKINHLRRKDKRTHHSHHWDLFRVALQAYFFYRKTSCSAGTDIHCCSHCRRNQRISHMHNVLLLFVFCFFLFLLYYAKIRPASPRGGYFFRFFRDLFCSLLPIFYEHFV